MPRVQPSQKDPPVQVAILVSLRLQLRPPETSGTPPGWPVTIEDLIEEEDKR